MNNFISVRETRVREQKPELELQLATEVKYELSRSGPPLTASGFVQLTARLFFKDSSPQTIAFVSCTAQEGSSFISNNFKQFLMNVGAQVSLLQAHECLSWPHIKRHASGGSFRSALFASEAFVCAKNNADVVLIDCPSLDKSPAIFMLASHIDGIVIVLEDGKHSAIELRNAISSIKDAKGTVLGVVLNNRRLSLRRRLYDLLSRVRQ